MLSKKVEDVRSKQLVQELYAASIYYSMVEHLLPTVDATESLCLRLDLEEALSQLPARDRLICALLRRGESQAEIARTLGISPPAVHKRIGKVATRLRKLGLDSYSGKA